MHDGPIIIIGDNNESIENLRDCFSSINPENEIMLFNEWKALLDFLKTTDKDPFFILCDSNNWNATEDEIKSVGMRLKAIPFLFLCADEELYSIAIAHGINVQGCFTKPAEMNEVANMLRTIVSYWQYAKRPVAAEAIEPASTG